MKIKITEGPYKGYMADVISVSKKQHVLPGQKKYTSSSYKVSVNDLLSPKLTTVYDNEFIETQDFKRKRKSSSPKSIVNKKRSRGSSDFINSSYSSRSNSRGSSRSQEQDQDYKDNFEYFNFLQEKHKKDQVYLDVNDFITLMNIEADYNLVKNFSSDIKEIIKKYFKNKEINIKLFIIAYFFVHFNMTSSNIPYRPQYVELVAPNDNFLYILNAAIYNKFINKQIDIDKYQEYISVILESKNTFIKKSTQYSKKILQDIRKSKKFTPELEKQRFFKNNITNTQALDIKKNIIKNIINNIKKRSFTKNINKDFLLKKLNDLLYSNKDRDILIKDQNELLYRDIRTSEDINKSPTEKMFNEIKKKIQGEIAFKINEIMYKGDSIIDDIVKSQIKDILKLKLNEKSLDSKERNTLKEYYNNIGDKSYISRLSSEQKGFVENYNKAYNALLKFNLETRPSTMK